MFSGGGKVFSLTFHSDDQSFNNADIKLRNDEIM